MASVVSLSIMDRLLADETILRIFSFLAAADLARMQLVSKHLRTLAQDRHLWKRLFYFTFVQPLNGASSSSHVSILPTLRELRSLLLHQNLLSGKHVTGDGSRPIHRLPSRYYSPSSHLMPSFEAGEDVSRTLSSLLFDRLGLKEFSDHHLLDWEQIFRVSTNWQRGKFTVSELLTSDPRTTSGLEPHLPRSFPHTIVRVSNRFILTATSIQDEHHIALPTISIYSSDPDLASQTSPPHALSHISSDLHRNPPALRFTSPGLQSFLASSSSHAQALITEIAVDTATAADNTPPITSGHRKRKLTPSEQTLSNSVSRIVVAYSTGHISLFSLYPLGGTISFIEDVFYKPKSTASEGYITMAALHTPALVLCSSKFDLAFYQISNASATRLSLVHSLSSYRCSSPASLCLRKLPLHHASKRPERPSSVCSGDRQTSDDHADDAAFRVTLAYSTPSYPSSWSVSVQELVVRLNLDPAATSTSQITRRHATAKRPFRPTPIDPRGRFMLGRHHSSSPHASCEAWMQSLTAQSLSGPSASRSTSLTYDDPFVVLGASDNLVEVYELLGATTIFRRGVDDLHAQTPASRSATATSSSPRQTLRLVHRHSLHGHTGSVHSVALEDGRCVSGGADGSVMVWNLGDRSNETDSIASAMRHVRAEARGFERQNHANDFIARSANSAFNHEREEEEEEETATDISHVLTLRSPTAVEELVALGLDAEAGHAEAVNARPFGTSLGHIVRSRLLDRQARSVVRWVSTAFDKIVSIVAYTDATSSSAAADDFAGAQRPLERVQVWSFS